MPTMSLSRSDSKPITNTNVQITGIIRIFCLYVTTVRVYFLARSLARRQRAGRQDSALKLDCCATVSHVTPNALVANAPWKNHVSRSVVLCDTVTSGAV